MAKATKGAQFVNGVQSWRRQIRPSAQPSRPTLANPLQPGPLCSVVDNFGEFWGLLGTFGEFGSSFGHFGPFWSIWVRHPLERLREASLDQFWTNFGPFWRQIFWWPRTGPGVDQKLKKNRKIFEKKPKKSWKKTEKKVRQVRPRNKGFSRLDYCGSLFVPKIEKFLKKSRKVFEKWTEKFLAKIWTKSVQKVTKKWSKRCPKSGLPKWAKFERNLVNFGQFWPILINLGNLLQFGPIWSNLSPPRTPRTQCWPQKWSPLSDPVVSLASKVLRAIGFAKPTVLRFQHWVRGAGGPSFECETGFFLRGREVSFRIQLIWLI